MQHDQGYGSEQVDMTGSNHSPHGSPQHGYTSSFDFTLPAPSSFDQSYSNAPYQAPYSAPQPLHPLNTATLWPSQLTNPSPPSSSSPPSALPLQPRPLASVTQESPREQTSAPSPPPPARTTPILSTSRKTLTDNDRRRMCKYHEENPTVKQTEIGGKSIEPDTIAFAKLILSYVRRRAKVREGPQWYLIHANILG